MNAENLPDVVSRNTIIDHLGSEVPQDFVVVSGHIDSWDVGQGVMDDAGGVFVSYKAALALRTLGLRPRRTIRTIFWTAEELGIYGGEAYFDRHRNESAHYQLMMESDFGTFTPRGIGIGSSLEVACIIQEIVKLTAAINTTEVEIVLDGPDIEQWADVGVPIGSLLHDSERYFWFHHTAGDSMEVEDIDDLDKISALWAAVAFVTADLSIDLQSLQ
ncbi:Peptidase M28 [Trinorchestia longiramus]|nr:Peptidase M28 [Trinorchestia longiramus]